MVRIKPRYVCYKFWYLNTMLAFSYQNDAVDNVFWPAFGCCTHLNAMKNIFTVWWKIWINHLGKVTQNFSITPWCSGHKRMNKKFWKWSKKYFYQFLGAHSTWILVKIHRMLPLFRHLAVPINLRPTVSKTVLCHDMFSSFRKFWYFIANQFD